MTPLNADTVAISVDGERQHILVQAYLSHDNRPSNFCITPEHAYVASIHTESCVVQKTWRQKADEERREAQFEARLASFQERWSSIVGEEPAKNSYPVRLTETDLVVLARSSAWSKALFDLSNEILTAVGDLDRIAYGTIFEEQGYPVRRLKFRVGRVPAAGVSDQQQDRGLPQ